MKCTITQIDDEGNQSTSPLLNKLMLYSTPTKCTSNNLSSKKWRKKKAWAQYENLSLREHHIVVI